MRNYFVLVFLSVSGVLFAQKAFQSEIVWDKASHNAFTSIVEYRGALYLAFREGKKHVDRNGGDDGIIRLLKSEDGEMWNSIDSVKIGGHDLRDPQLFVSNRGQLSLSYVAATYKDGHATSYHTFLSEVDSDNVQPPTLLKTPFRGDWIWRIHWVKGKAYGFNYINTFDLMSSDDGHVFNVVKSFALPGKATETDFVVIGNEVLAVVNRDYAKGLMGIGSLEDGRIEWHEMQEQFVGPMLIPVSSEKLLFLATEYVAPNKLEARIYQIKGRSLYHIGTVPSNGDSGYMGAAVFNDRLYVSYYSTVKPGKVAVYISKIPLLDLNQ